MSVHTVGEGSPEVNSRETIGELGSVHTVDEGSPEVNSRETTGELGSVHTVGKVCSHCG